MDVEYLRYYLTIANSSSINQAASRLYLSHQHLNRILTTIETTLDTKLVHRDRTGITLTQSGRDFLEYAEKIVVLYDEARYKCHQTNPHKTVNTSLHGECTLHIPLIFTLYISDFIASFSACYPNIQLTMIEPASNFSASDFSEIGLYIITDTFEAENTFKLHRNSIHAEHFMNVEMVCCMNRSQPLADRKTITQDDFHNLQMTLYPGQKNYADSKKILFTSANLYQHLDAVLQNNTVCHISLYAVPKIHALYPDIVTLRYENLTMPMYFVWNHEYHPTECDKALMNFVKGYFHNLLAKAAEIMNIK